MAGSATKHPATNGDKSKIAARRHSLHIPRKEIDRLPHDFSLSCPISRSPLGCEAPGQGGADQYAGRAA